MSIGGWVGVIQYVMKIKAIYPPPPKSHVNVLRNQIKFILL